MLHVLSRRWMLGASLALPGIAGTDSASAQTGDRAPNWTRQVAIARVPEDSRYKETYGVNIGRMIELEGQLLLPRNVPSKTLFIIMHPTGLSQRLPMPKALAEAGVHVLCGTSRYPSNDSALIMEKVALDMGAWVNWAKTEGGYEKVVLVGWSGGGSLSLFYQAQAERPTIIKTPAGDDVDLVAARLPRADGIIFIAAHMSRAEVLTEWLDPSVRDERDPENRDLEFDIYDPACPHKPPFSADFVAAFRAAQVARNRKITAYTDEWLDKLRRRGDVEVERSFVVHRTMCDVRWIDPTIDPNGRRPNWSYQGDPRTVNVGTTGLARYTSLRSWLSQWSFDRTNTKATKNAPLIGETPVLQIENGADDAVPATHIPTVRAALATKDKEFVRIEGANHYYAGQPDLARQCIDAVLDWSRRKKLLET